MNILLTSDDGYNSIGIRLLVHFLKAQHTVTIAATLTQQSAVGGKLSIRDGGKWGQTTVDGVSAFWVDGTPGDAMEFMYAHSKEPFDLVISGVNLGENVSVASISSGTVCAAWRALGLAVAKRAIAMSWVTPGDFYFKKHDASEPLTSYLRNPGQMVDVTLQKVFAADFWSSNFLNINFPEMHSAELAFTRLAPSIRSCYPPLTVDDQTMTYAYPFVEANGEQMDADCDVVALKAGKISITPMLPDWTDARLFEAIKK